jgi:DNA modification methylase
MGLRKGREEKVTTVKLIPLADVVVEKRQRTDMNPVKLAELQASISGRGLLHPPVMWLRDDGKWVLSVGERRLRAIQGLALELKSIRFADGTSVPLGEIPITPLGDYLDEIGRFEAEFDENIVREDISWQDRVQALADLHRMRLAQNPKQTFVATGQEMVNRSGGGITNLAHARAQVSEAVAIAQHLDDPAIANARNHHEALSLILRKEEARINAELVKRRLVKMSEKPSLEVRHGDLLKILPALDIDPIDLILCDPPYGVDASGAGFRSRTVHHHNYDDDPDTARLIARTILTEGFKLTKPRANIFMFGAIESFEWWKNTAANLGWVPFNRPLIWCKSESEGLAPWGGSGPRITTEFIFYATKGQRGLNASPIDVFRISRVPRHERIHAAEKPVELLAKLIECSTIPGELVFDPCCGSGSTLVACRETKRIGFGIEKAETYFNIALQNIHTDPLKEASESESPG